MFRASSNPDSEAKPSVRASGLKKVTRSPQASSHPPVRKIRPSGKAAKFDSSLTVRHLLLCILISPHVPIRRDQANTTNEATEETRV